MSSSNVDSRRSGGIPTSTADAEPNGLDSDDIWPEINRRPNQQGWDIVEATAKAGDVELAHPLMFHSSNPNHGTRPRVMSQPRYDMTEPKRTRGNDLFPVEIPIVQAKGRAAART